MGAGVGVAVGRRGWLYSLVGQADLAREGGIDGSSLGLMHIIM